MISKKRTIEVKNALMEYLDKNLYKGVKKLQEHQLFFIDRFHNNDKKSFTIYLPHKSEIIYGRRETADVLCREFMIKHNVKMKEHEDIEKRFGFSLIDIIGYNIIMNLHIKKG